MRPPWPVVLACAAAASGGRRSLIKIDNQNMRDESIDPEEYLWETLPGRCCFQELVDQCDLCSVWSDPENFCHMSADNCEQCGMQLYCEPPPALLDANKVCVGESRVGVGCDDDLDTGMCKRAGSLAACQAACRRTEHCEMVSFFTDARAGSCVLCRNLLHFEPTGLASTRVYAVSHVDVAPPALPGGGSKGPKHFSIIEDPSPPPPPKPPPKPPGRPPPPLPATLGMAHTETHIECTFLEGMDFSVAPGTTAGASVDTTAETQKHCCNKCGLQPGCTDFVYEPASKTCVLLPHVPTAELVKTPNPSTVAGTVSISHVSNFHASCEFEVGSGYAGGSLGAAEPLTKGMAIATQQERCAASARPCISPVSHARLTPASPRCRTAATRASATPTARNLCTRSIRATARCASRRRSSHARVARAPSPRSLTPPPPLLLAVQLFASFAEHYYTFGLLSGIVTGRSALGDAGDGASIYAEEGLKGDPFLLASGGGEGDDLPPAPPTFNAVALEAPSPPPGEYYLAKRIVADMSLSIGAIMVFGFAICAYCFFSPQLLAALHRMSGGKLGRRPKNLHDRLRNMNKVDGDGRPPPPKLRAHKRHAKLPPGWAKVTVQTARLTQKRAMDVGSAESVDELRDAIWDEFGHLLSTVRPKDTLILCWVGGAAGGRDDDDDDDDGWLHVTSASDVAAVVRCTALKLTEKSLVSQRHLSVAFPRALCGKAGGGELADRPTRRPRTLRNGKGGFERLATTDDSPPEDNAKQNARTGGRDSKMSRERRRGNERRRATGSGGDEGGGGGGEEGGGGGDEGGGGGGENPQALCPGTVFATGSRRSGPAAAAEQLVAGAPPPPVAAAVDDDAMSITIGPELLGRRVEVHGLASMLELNGSQGVATRFDEAKGKYHVRLDGAAKVLAFRERNLRRL